MPNIKIINSIDDPLYTMSSISTYASRESQLGLVYTVSQSPQSVAVSSFLTLQITNPSASAKTVYINSIFGGSTDTINLSILRNGSFSASGTSLTPHNNNWAYSDSSICSSKYIITGSDPTSGGTRLESLYQSSGNFYLFYQGQLIISPGAADQYLCLRAENPSLLSAVVVTLGVTWWES